MTAKDLIEKLSEVSPDTEIVSGMWNGRVDTYTVILLKNVLSSYLLNSFNLAAKISIIFVLCK